MPSDSKFTKDEDGNTAVRVVVGKEALPASDKDWMFARDENGNIAVRVVNGAGSGSDQHNLGWYATQAALEEAHPTAEAGDWAIVGATDTVWIWDTDNSEWVDSDQKGQVTSVNGQTGDVVLDLLPSQTGNEGKFLTTDGTDASWSDTTNSFTISGRSGVAESGHLLFKTNDMGYTPSIQFVSNNGTRNGSISGVSTTPKGLSFGVGSSYKHFDITESGIRMGWIPSANTEVALGGSDTRWTNVYTKKLNNGADITVPAVAGSMAVQVSSLPTAVSTLEGQIYQYIGATDSTYTHGYIYECKAQGTDPETYAWTRVDVQPAPVIPDPLPSQTGNAGKFLTTDGTGASWSESIKLDSGAATFWRAGVYGNVECLKLGFSLSASATTPDIGVRLVVDANKLSIWQLRQNTGGTLAADIVEPGTGNTKTLGTPTNAYTSWNITYTKNINAGSGADNIAVPTTGGTMAVIGVNTTATLATADWSSNTQTVTVSGVKADSIVFVSPAPASASDYATAGILCTSQSADSLTFTCTTTPSNAITVNVVCM